MQDEKKFKVLKYSIIISCIYDIITLGVIKFKNVYLGIFLLGLGIINFLFVKKVEIFQLYDEETKKSKSKTIKIFALILQFINTNMCLIFCLYRNIGGMIPLECLGLGLKIMIIIYIMDNTADELNIKWKNKEKRI